MTAPPRRITADMGRRLPATRPQPVARDEVPAGAWPSGGAFGTVPSPSLSRASATAPQAVSSPLDAAASVSQAANPADGAVIVPPVEANPDSRNLPIYDAVESHWFSGGSAPHWSSPADAGWQAAEAADSPSSGGSTGAGLPRRTPNTNLIPGAIPSQETVIPARSATAARDRFAALQRGVSEARAVAASEAANAGTEDES